MGPASLFCSRTRALLTLLLLSVGLQQSAYAVLANGFPEKLAIYYGPPEMINGSAGNTTTASGYFSAYDLLVLPAQMEDPANSHHTATATIISNIKPATRSYGYIDLCWQNPVSTLYTCGHSSESQLEAMVDQWNLMGVAGIFLDQAGCDYVVSRDRQNAIIDYIHSKNLSVFINSWNQDDVFYPGSVPSPYAGYADCNPSHLTTHLGANDYTLLESWAVILSDWSENYTADPNTLVPRGNKALGYKNTYGTKVATVNTIASTNPPFNQAEFDYTWWSTLVFGFDAMAWGETWVYSADTSQMPFHARPNPNGGSIGSAVTPLAVAANGALYTRATTTNTILLDTAAHTGRFGSKNAVTQPAIRNEYLISGEVDFTQSPPKFILRSNGTPINNYHIFIDTDNNAASGFLHSDEGITNMGADYMVENNHLYHFTGGSQTSWTWTSVGTLSPTGVGTTTVQVPIDMSQIGSPAMPINVLFDNSDASWNLLDLLPRSNATLWQVRPTAFAQSGSTSSNLVSATATFAPYLQVSQVTFDVYGNSGGSIGYYRIFIDSDNNPATGFSYYLNPAIGADYMIENGILYRFTGSTPTSFTWTQLGQTVEYATPGGQGLGTNHIKATIVPDVIGYIPGNTLAVMAENVNPTTFASLDLLPRTSGTSWPFKSNLLAQGGNPGTLVLGDVSFPGSNITFTVNSNGGPISSYRVFIDSDHNAATGYLHAGLTSVGADYMIQDGKLYSFSGATQTTWGWTLVSNSVTDSGYGTSQIVATIAKSLVGYSSGMINVQAENFVSSTESIDLMERSTATVWHATP